MTVFDDAINYTLKYEGGLVENAKDSGGVTNLGISLRFLQTINEAATRDDIINMTLDTAKELYKTYFWRERFEKITSSQVAIYLFDFCVNAGEPVAVKHLQRACWSVAKDMTLKDDGMIGDVTIDQVNHSGFLLMPAFRAERANYYRKEVIKNPDNALFINGWLKRAYQL